MDLEYYYWLGKISKFDMANATHESTFFVDKHITQRSGYTHINIFLKRGDHTRRKFISKISLLVLFGGNFPAPKARADHFICNFTAPTFHFSARGRVSGLKMRRSRILRRKNEIGDRKIANKMVRASQWFPPCLDKI